MATIKDDVFSETKELLLAYVNGSKGLTIGIPKEQSVSERRVALTPLSVSLLIDHGYTVWIESNAGLPSNFTNLQYAEQGAQIIEDRAQIFGADIIIKIASPTLDEVQLISHKKILFSSQQPCSLEREVLLAMMHKQITALSYEYLRDEGGHLSVVRAMSEIVGGTTMLIAGEYLSNIHNGKGLMLGGITGVPPTEIVIIGAGTVGEFAARAAIALGAQVKVFDSSLYRLRRLQDNIGVRVYSSVIQPLILSKAVRSSDVVIGALRAKNGRSACIISEETVAMMKPNSVIIDVSIDQGGCFETSKPTSHDHPVFRKYDVIHYCVPNIASRVARTATYAFSNILTPLLIQLVDCGGLSSLIWSQVGVRNSIYLYQGNLTNKDMADVLDLTYKDLSLMIIANQ